MSYSPGNMDPRFSTLSGAFEAEYQWPDDDDWNEMSNTMYRFANTLSDVPMSSPSPPQDHLSPHTQHTTVHPPHTQPSTNNTGTTTPPTYATVARAGTQESVTPPMRASQPVPMRSTGQQQSTPTPLRPDYVMQQATTVAAKPRYAQQTRPAVTSRPGYAQQQPTTMLPRPSLVERQAHYDEYVKRNKKRTYAQVTRSSQGTQPGSNYGQHQLAPRNASASFQASVPSRLPNTPAYVDVNDQFNIGNEILANRNWYPGINEPPFNNTAGWTEQSRAADDRIKSWRTTPASSQQLSNSATQPPPTASSQTSTSRSRRTKEEMETGNYAHRCSIGDCRAGFNTLNELNHHVRCHKKYEERAFQCDVCHQRFTYDKDLKKHQVVHYPDVRPWLCPHRGCEYATKGFKRKDHRVRHLQAQHNGVDPVVQPSGFSSRSGY